MSELDPTAIELPTDSGRSARIGVLALVLGLGGFLAWAAMAPLDEGVPTQGQVSLDTKRKAVQHLSGGLIREVLVREGQWVKEGQVLVRLDEAMARANYEALRQRYLGLRATEARLQAEQAGRDSIRFHDDLMAAASDPQIQSQMTNQQQLLRSRRAALRAELQSIEEGIHGQLAQAQAFRGMLSQRRRQLALLSDELSNTREMVQEGYVPRNRQLELERMSTDTNASIVELMGNDERVRRSVSEQRQRALARKEEYQKEVETQLAEVTRDAQGDTEKFAAAKADLDRIEIRSPVSGQVVGLALQTVGGVVQPGQKLMDIVPQGESLLLEARIPPNLIDKVRAGLPGDVRFSAFSQTPQLVVDGKVESVSSDLITDPQNPQISYYLARVVVTPGGMKTLGQHRLQPGMPAEIVIKTGERSMLNYLLHPLLKRMAASMKEE